VSTKKKNVLPEDMAWYLDILRKAEVANDKALRIGLRNMRGYLGFDKDQWPDDLVAELEAEGRDVNTYNFLQRQVRIIAGNYIMNWYDPKLVDREDDGKDVNSAIYKLNRIYYADKDHFNYKKSSIMSIENGLVWRGIEELTVERSADEPLGRLAFNSLRPDMVVLDPSIIDDDITRSMRRLWKKFYLTPDEMILYYPDKEGEIRQRLLPEAVRDKFDGPDYDEHSVDFFRVERFLFGHKKQVVEYYHIEYEKERKVIHIPSGKTVPETGYPVGTAEDFRSVAIWAASQGYQLQPDDLTIRELVVPVLYRTAFCPDLGIVLDNRKDERQLNGHLPFYVWAYGMKYGKTVGVVDYLYALQNDINSREAQKLKMLTQTPINGKPFIHPDAIGEDQDRLKQEINNFNDSSKPFVFDSEVPAALTDRLIGIIPGTNVNAAIFQDETNKINMIDLIANTPPAMGGYTERSGESALHYGRKVIEGNITHRLSQENLLLKERYKVEDWVTMAVKVYGGRNKDEKMANLNRVFSMKEGDPVVANVLKGFDESGEPMVEGDISSLKRVDVIISQAKENDFQKQAKMEVDSMMLKSIPPTPNNGIVIATYVSDFIKSNTYEDDDQRMQAYEAADLYREIEMTNGKLLLRNLKAQLEQPVAPQTPGAPTGQGGPAGAPVELPSPVQPEQPQRPPV